MDRAEAAGLGVAVTGHLMLLAALTLGLANARIPPIRTQPIEVSFVDEVGLESAAPAPSAVEPAPKLAELEGPVEPTLAPPVPLPDPTPRPLPKAVPPAPAPAPIPRPAVRPRPPQPAAAQPARPTPPRPAPTRPTGRLKGLLSGLGDRDTPSRAATPPAATAGPAVEASLARAVLEQLKPHWKAPTGAEVELLRTELSISLARNGAVTRVEVIRTTGQTSSNRPQVKLHQEQAIRAVRLASPFRLPAEYYDVWKEMSPIRFDKRLSR